MGLGRARQIPAFYNHCFLAALGGPTSHLKPPIIVWGTLGLPMTPSFNAITVWLQGLRARCLLSLPLAARRNCT